MFYLTNVIFWVILLSTTWVKTHEVHDYFIIITGWRGNCRPRGSIWIANEPAYLAVEMMAKLFSSAREIYSKSQSSSAFVRPKKTVVEDRRERARAIHPNSSANGWTQLGLSSPRAGGEKF